MVVRTERTLRGRLQVSVNMGVIVHGFPQPYVISGFVAFLARFLRHTRRNRRKWILSNHNLPSEYEYPKQMTLWLVVVVWVFHVACSLRWGRACSQTLFTLDCFSSRVIIFLLKEVFRLSLSYSPLAFSFCSTNTAGSRNNFHHRSHDFWDS